MSRTYPDIAPTRRYREREKESPSSPSPFDSLWSKLIWIFKDRARRTATSIKRTVNLLGVIKGTVLRNYTNETAGTQLEQRELLIVIQI